MSVPGQAIFAQYFTGKTEQGRQDVCAERSVLYYNGKPCQCRGGL